MRPYVVFYEGVKATIEAMNYFQAKWLAADHFNTSDLSKIRVL